MFHPRSMAGSYDAATALPCRLAERSPTMTGVALAVGRAKRDGPFSGERFGILTPFR
jgi:hypothetical protein